MSLIRAKPLVDLMHSQAEANWIEQNEPDIWQQVHNFCFYLAITITSSPVNTMMLLLVR